MLTRSLLIACFWAAGSNAGRSEAFNEMNLMMNQSFAGYMKAFGKSYAEGSVEHGTREEIFNERLAEILAHNAGGPSWRMGLNQFTDWDENELQKLRGFKKEHQHFESGVFAGTSVIELGNNGDGASCSSKEQSCANGESCCSDLTCGSQAICEKPAGAADAMDWASQLATSMDVMNQGGCGSCWAVAAAAAVQLQAAKQEKQFKKILSPQNILACAPNPMSCGGDGGCEGSTPGLAFDYLKKLGSSGGLTTLDQLPYTASTHGKVPDDTCSNSASSFLQTKRLRNPPGPPSVSIAGWTKLEDNHAEKVFDALVTAGPLAVAVVGSGIQGYSEGVIHNCKSNEVDHAVVMMGYGYDPKEKMKYWNIRNSWGKEWGEKGFFRLQRTYARGTKASASLDAKDPGGAAPSGWNQQMAGGEPCGWDMDPAKGVACKNEKGEYPKKTWVCGACGIISDVAYPTGIKVHPSLLS